MKGFPYKFINRVRREARRRPTVATVEVLGRPRTFVAFDWGSDTFVFERDIWGKEPNRDPVLVVRKSLLVPDMDGFIMTVTSGNHSIAAMPLLKGELWNLGRVQPRHRSEAMLRSVVCCNIVGDTIEISQRDVHTRLIVETDEWLRGLGWPLAKVVLADRVDATLDYYRRLGQEWRIKPLAWTREEMELALRASRARIHAGLTYYHGVKGVHLLACGELTRMAELARTDSALFNACLDELVGVPQGSTESLTRTPKFHGHHEVELFGMRGSQAIETIIPELERIHAAIRDGTAGPADAVTVMRQVLRLYEQSLENRALADESSPVFVESMYKHLTGEVYYSNPDQVIPVFDDRKTALPGATYRGGKPEVHPGTDARTRAILDYVEALLSHGEIIDYINVYELRSDKPMPLGKGPAREIVYKTTRRPLCQRLIEKRLAQLGSGYGNYMLSRVQAFQNLGVAYGDHHLLARHDRLSGEVHFFIRQRYPGYAFGQIARTRFLHVDEGRGSAEDPEVVLAIAALMGNAAAQNMAVKKYVPEKNSNQFGQGKEIIEFGYDVQRGREMPLRIRMCSVRGTLGWPQVTWSEENLSRCFDFYIRSFARVVAEYWREHASAVTTEAVFNSFYEGFASTTRELHWNYMSQREQFDLFNPDVRHAFDFKEKWRFALWALGQQNSRLAALQDMLKQRVKEHVDAMAPPAGPIAASAPDYSV